MTRFSRAEQPTRHPSPLGRGPSRPAARLTLVDEASPSPPQGGGCLTDHCLAGPDIVSGDARSTPRTTARHPVEKEWLQQIFHGRSGQLYQRYQDGMEDQIGALGLVLNALVLFNTRYMDAAVNQLRADGFDVRDEDVARLSPFVRHHINMLGRYSFQLPELPGGLRPLRDPDAPADD